MSGRRGEIEAFLGSSSPDQRSENRSKLPLCEHFFTVGAVLSRIRLAGGGSRRPSKRVNVDRGQFVGRDLDDFYAVMHLREFAPVGRRPASERKRRRLERLAKMYENLTDGPRL